ncbi:CPBP family intramembrane glutamic endopeptidase [Clostridium sp. AWRP]|uniref:CPBP family intramembrane glutamic endopeptidase n=1 Tax=Clostridium sp. AWRP TaxID=2212991 RepID=UPI001FAB1CA8|nr:CPBP family intramembrane glutamic endopeptidase [Clostridium sp. AWRP]
MSKRETLEYKASSLDGYYKLLFKMIPVAVAINPIMCLAQCFGEEFAWRGYLLPKLCKIFSPWKATLLTGVIGIIGFVVLAIICFIRIYKDKNIAKQSF